MRKLAAALLVSPAIAFAGGADTDVTAQRDRQAAIQADTDQLARRLGTMLRVMEHYKLDEAAGKKMLEEAAGTLKGLSADQMTAVLAKLDAAAAAADADASREHLESAYNGHRETLRQLKGLLANYDAIRNLEQAIGRLERAAREELEMSFRTADILADSIDQANVDIARRRVRRMSEFPTVRARRESEEQVDHRKDFEQVLRAIEGIRSSLPADQRPRVDAMKSQAGSKKLVEKMNELPQRIRSEGDPAQRQREWGKAVDGLWTVAGDLHELTRTLGKPQDKLQVMRDARHKLAALVDQHATEGTESQTFFANPPTAEPEPPRAGLFRRPVVADEPVFVKARQCADSEGRQAFAVRGLMVAIAPHAPVPAAALERAIKSMRAADASFRQTAPLSGRMYQLWADTQLRQALGELDEVLVKSERERSDPLEATKATLEKVEQLIKDQKKVNEETDRHAQSKNDEAAMKQAPKQAELAERGAEVAKMPLPSNLDAKDALKEAAETMKAATDELAKRDPKAADKKQEEAIEVLEEAAEYLKDQVKAIQDRRDDIGKLEDAKKKLDELTKAEKQVASDAEKAADMPKDVAKNPEKAPTDANKNPGEKLDPKDIAKNQEKLTPPTKDVAKDIETAAPDASKTTKDAAEKMEAAKADLEKMQPKDGAEKADAAAKDLKKAQEQVAKALDKKRAEELMDQAKLSPQQMDALQAAMEVKKALESTTEAAMNSENAAKNPAAENLAKAQQELAKKAGEMGNEPAAKPADKAAKDIQKGDLEKAAGEQAKALEQLAKDGKAGDLAKEQKDLMEATKSMAKSQAANAEAMAALQQAMAQSPQAIQPQLQDAAKELAKAGEQLQKGQPKQAGDSQQQAAEALGEAMATLAIAADAMAKAMPPGQQPPPPPGQQPGQQPGQKPAEQPTPGQEKNDTPANGDRTPDGKLKNAKAESNGVDGDGAFLHLPARQRELIRQALTEKLPPDYSALIQQYYVNIARGKPAAKPSTEPKRDK